MLAVKIPRQHVFSSTNREQFLREARLTAQLDHPNIVTVHEVGSDNDQLYIVSDFIKGITLAEHLSTGQFSLCESATLCATIARVWDSGTGEQIAILKGHSYTVLGIAFHPDGSQLATGSFDGTARTWDPVTGQQILAACDDGSVKVFDSKEGELLVTLQGHTGPVSWASWSPGGERIASGSHDGSVRIWDAITGREVLSLHGHGRQVTTVCFDPQGQMIASGGIDGTVRIWDARPLDSDEKK
jgi:WD40 repeat protein